MSGRRDFLKLVSSAMGGALLTSCGSSGGGGGLIPGGPDGGTSAPLPNAMRFYRVYGTGETDGTLGSATGATGGVLINNAGKVLFYGIGDDQRLAAHELTLDLSGDRPAIGDRRTLVSEGDATADGGVVERLHGCATNDAGDFAAVLDAREGELVTPGIYMDIDETGHGMVEDLFEHGDQLETVNNRASSNLPAGDIYMGGMVGDIDLSSRGDLLFTAHFNVDQEVPYQGLFSFNPRSGRAVTDLTLVSYTGLGLPQSDAIMGGYGLLDLSDDGDYVAQVHVEGPDSLMNRLRGHRVEPATGLILGNIHSDFSRARLLHASPAVAGRAAGGESYMGPRVSNSDHLSYVIHHSDDDVELVFAGATVARTGGTSPSGHPIMVPGPGAVCGPAGLCYYLLATDEGLELCVSNGNESKTLLSRGDEVDGLIINTLVFGMHSDQVDRQGRIVLEADFDNGQTGILLGLPA